MQGLIRAFARLLVMGGVMAAVAGGALFAGVGLTTAVALGIVLAGAVGLIGLLRRPRMARAAAAPTSHAASVADHAREAAPGHAPSLAVTTGVDSMAPKRNAEVDPEANMPRWRRPSLIEARRSDPLRYRPAERMPMRFDEGHAAEVDLRVVRYAVVPVLDRPDEVLGLRLSDIGSGDEVQVIGSSGAFLEVMCPNGDQGFVHRTTLGQRESAEAAHVPQEADDALAALLTARGLI